MPTKTCLQKFGYPNVLKKSVTFRPCAFKVRFTITFCRITPSSWTRALMSRNGSTMPSNHTRKEAKMWVIVSKQSVSSLFHCERPLSLSLSWVRVELEFSLRCKWALNKLSAVSCDMFKNVAISSIMFKNFYVCFVKYVCFQCRFVKHVCFQCRFIKYVHCLKLNLEWTTGFSC